jgi:ACS family glucarate transporter-like MFS transporter
MTESLMPEERPTHARHWVIVFAASLAAITYIDRVAIAQAAPFISSQLKLTPVRMGYILAAFGWSYALFEVPSGWLGDRTGAKSALTRIVTFWSLFTAATAWAWNFASLFIIRFLFGAGEAGCFPNLTKTFKAWLRPAEQARAQGIMWMSARLGGAFAPYFVYLMFRYFSWQRAFVLLGLVGVVWSAVFFRWYRDDPHTHPGVNQAERALLPEGTQTPAHVSSIPWKQLLTSKAVWLLSVQYFCLGYGWDFYVTWLPTYLIQARHVPLQTASVLSGLPLFMGAFACATSAILYPRLVYWLGSTQRTWRTMAFLGFSGAPLFLLASTTISQPVGAVVCMALASFSNDLTMPGTWAAAMEVGGPYAGTTCAFMNMLSCISGSVQAVLTGYIIHWTNGNWQVAIYSFVAVYIVGFMCWFPLGSPLMTAPAREFALTSGRS